MWKLLCFLDIGALLPGAIFRVSPVFLNSVLDAFGHTRPKDAAISDLRLCKEGESTFRCYQTVASA